MSISSRPLFNLFRKALHEGAAALLLHVAIDGGARDAPEDGDLWPCGLVDHDDQREAHRDQDAHQDAQEESAQEGRHLGNERRNAVGACLNMLKLWALLGEMRLRCMRIT